MAEVSAPDYIWSSDIFCHFSHTPIQFAHVGKKCGQKRPAGTELVEGPLCMKSGVTTKTVDKWIAEKRRGSQYDDVAAI